MAIRLTPSCVLCCNTFSASRTDARYCTPNCRLRAWHDRLNAWKDLARRQTAAVREGDVATLEAIAVEAAHLESLEGR